jgi:hypothetical protein
MVKLASLVISLILALAPAAAQPLLGPDQIMPTSEIRPGMIATGKTVFRGTEIEEFHLEILGVAPKARSGSDVILARVLDGTLVQRQSSILAGMSGTPVYIGGRLIGAIAFSWSFVKEPVAGITPIQDMLRVLEAAGEQEPSSEQQPPGGQSPPAGQKTAAASLDRPLVIGGRAFNSIRILDASAPVIPNAVEPPATLTLRPVGSIFLVSGASPRGLERLRELVEPFGAAVTQGVGGSSDAPAAKLEPGSAMGVQLVRGDFDATAIGTVTAVIGDKVLAFGHPMMSMGDVDMPLSGAVIQAIVPSYATSMKMGIASAPVGRISQDRLWAVVGVAGQLPRGIPISITVTDSARGTSQSFNADIVRHRLLSPALAAAVTLSAVDRAWGHIGQGTAEVTVEIEGAQGTIRRTDAAFSPGDAAASITAALAAPLASLMDNEFGSLDIKALRLTARLTAARNTARLQRLTAEPGKHKAGETLKLNVLLRPFKGAEVEKAIALKLPPDLPDGPLRVGVAGGAEIQPLRSALGLAPRRPFNLDQLVSIYQTDERSDELVALAALPSIGVSVAGRQLPSLPTYLVESLAGARSSVIDPQRDFIKASITTEWLLEGRQIISVDIEGKPGVGRRRPPKGQPLGPPGEAPKEEQAQPGEEEEEGLIPMMAPVAAGPADSDEEQPAAQEKKKEKEKEEPVGRKPSSFTHAKRSDFLPGDFDAIACDQDGALTLAPQATTVAALDEPVISALLIQQNEIYVATAPGGRVRRLSSDGRVQQTWDTGAVFITSLLAGAEGAVLAGAAPGGRILSLLPDGKVQDYFATSDENVWAIAPAPGGGFYAGTGPGGKVFLITGPGHGRMLCQLPATNVHSLAVAGQTLYAGTANAGVIYAIDPSGQTRAVYESDQESVTSLALGADGDLYAGTAPEAFVIRLRAGRAEQIMQAEGKHLTSLAASPSGTLYAVTAEDGVVYEIDPARKAASVLRKPEHRQAIALALDQRGAVYVAESNPAAVVRLGPDRAPRGVFTSKPQQVASGTRWGVASCGVERPDGTTATIQTRSGDGADPDDHWSPWSALSDLGSATPIASPPARFLQYRVALATQQPGVTPTARDVQISYLPPNREPSVLISAPKAADRLRTRTDLKWKGQDPDGDTLIYDLALSADGGKTWKEIKRDIEDTSYSWDTTGFEDGAYLLRVIASDRLSNPGAARENEARQLLWVDNTPPTVVALRSSLAVTPQRRATFRGAAADELSPLRGVDYRVDEGKWRAAAVEGLAGTQDASFSVETDPLAAGEHKVQVRAFDQAGNSAQDEVRVKVEAPPAEVPKPGAKAEAPKEAPAKAESERAAPPAADKPAAKTEAHQPAP